MIAPTTSDVDRFMRFVSPEPNSGCWLFTGHALPKGYCPFQFGGRGGVHTYAHRFSYEHVGRKALPQDAHVLHSCDVPCCVNPEHLFLGDQAANMQDMAAKGRNVLTNRPLENSLKTHCSHGHALSGPNLWIRADGSRICKACRARIARNWRKNNAR
jgi:hypothetical protein